MHLTLIHDEEKGCRRCGAYHQEDPSPRVAASAEVPPGASCSTQCAARGLYPALNWKDITIIGEDQSEEAIEACKENLRRTVPNVSFRQLNAASLDLPDASVSAIVSDLPWGRQTELQGVDEHGYTAVLQVMCILAAFMEIKERRKGNIAHQLCGAQPGPNPYRLGVRCQGPHCARRP